MLILITVFQFVGNIVIGNADTNGIFNTRFSIDKNGNGYTYGHVDCAGLLTAPNSYNTTQVDNLLIGKAECPNFRDLAKLNYSVQGFPLLGGG